MAKLTRKFLTDDIMALSTTAQRYPLKMALWLETLSEAELMMLWDDLIAKEPVL